jgi:type I restriction enzyme S subunit
VTTAYQDYRDANSQWVDRIPARWRIERLKFVARPQASNVDKHSKDDEIPVRLCNYTDVYNNAQITADMDFMEATATQAEIEKFTLTDDEVIITKDSESWEDIAVPTHVPKAIEGVLCGYHLTQIRPDKERLDGRYLYYQLCSAALNRQFQVKANGVTRFGLPAYHIDNAETIVPPIEDQRRIAGFLDEKTAKIDALISRKAELINALNEQRSALIERAVTLGLGRERHVEAAELGWIDRIPSGWSVKRIKHLANLKSGEAITALEMFDDGEFPVYGGNGLRGRFDQYTHEGDLVLIGRQGALCGNINYASGRFWASEHAVVANPVADFNTVWFGELLRTMNLNQYSVSAAQPGLSVDNIARLFIPVPPLSEQNEIAEYITSETKGIQEISDGISSAIKRLTEYRSAIITAAVTGQIKVV